MGKVISIMRRRVTFLSPNIINKAIQARTLAHLDYCPAVWSNSTGDMLKKLQCMQNRAAPNSATNN